MIIQHTGFVTTRPSPGIWSRIDFAAMREKHNGVEYFEDFAGWNGTFAANVGTYGGSSGGWRSFENGNCTILPLATVKEGAVQLLLSAVDDTEFNMQRGLTGQVHAIISTTTPDDCVLGMEFRFRLGQVTNATHNLFLGLTEENLAVTDGFFADTGVIADKDYIGFIIAEAAGATLTFGWNKQGGVDVVGFTYGTALVVNTWYKVGFLYDPGAPDSKKIKIFIDGVEQGTYVTATQLASANFPNGEELTSYINFKNGSAAAKTADLDWIRFAQVWE